MKAGRNTKLTPDLQKEICKNISSGLSNVDACKISNINETTFYDWLSRGDTGEKPYAKFVEAVEIALLKFKRFHIGQIVIAGKSKWQANAWILERKYPKEFGRTIEHSGKVDLPSKRKRLEVVILDPKKQEDDKIEPEKQSHDPKMG